MDDIVGAFDIDDFGNILLDKESLRDNFNRPVNKHGYLVDSNGNIINQEGQIIFEAEELDSDEELPMPYKFESRKKQLLKAQEKFTIDPSSAPKHVDDENLLALEEEKVEEELHKLRSLSRGSSADSNLGDSPSKYELQNQADKDDEDEGEESKGKRKKGKFSKKEIRLAKAYGGEPASKLAKKKKKTDVSQGSGKKLER